MPKELVTRRHVAYYKAYAELAVTQLIIGAYFGPNGGYAHGSEKTQLDALKNHASDLIFTGSAIFHDITHSFIALALSDDPKSLTALIPDFQKLPSGREAYASEDEYYYAHGQLVSDEILVFSFDGTQSRTSMLLAIQSMPEDEFIRCFSSHSRDPKRRALAARLLGRLYRELPKNPTIFFDIFADVTMPLMQTHAPKEAAAFANETESIRLAA
jgi:hypothetical protein